MKREQIIIMAAALFLLLALPVFAKGYTDVVKISGKAIVEEGKMPVIKEGKRTIVLMVPGFGRQREADAEGNEFTPLIKDGDKIEAEGFFLFKEIAGLDIRLFRAKEMKINGKFFDFPEKRRCKMGRGAGNGENVPRNKSGARNGQGRRGQEGKRGKANGADASQRNGFGRKGNGRNRQQGSFEWCEELEKVELTGTVTVEEGKDVLLKSGNKLYVVKFDWKSLPADFDLETGDNVTVKGLSSDMPFSATELKFVHTESLTKGGSTVILPKGKRYGRQGFFGKGRR